MKVPGTGLPDLEGKMLYTVLTMPLAMPLEKASKDLSVPNTLFGVLTSTSMAEDLPYGPGPLTDTASAYFCTDCSSAGTTWTQTFACDGSTVDMTIEYVFDSAMTPFDRIKYCSDYGCTVDYTVSGTSVGTTEKFTGNFWFSSGTVGSSSSGSGLASDDGLWGAGTSQFGIVDGETGGGNGYCPWSKSGFYGFGNCNKYDSYKGSYMFYGSTSYTTCPNLMSMLYAGPAVASAPVSVHGDPMFQHDGKGQHFWLKEHVLSELLSWSKDGHKYTLHGKVIANTETGHQWFKQIVLKSDDIEAFSASMTRADDLKPTLLTSSNSSLGVDSQLKVEGHESNPKSVTYVDAGGMKFALTAEGAHKYSDSVQQEKYSHVNVKMPEGLVKDATGLFAELAGAQPMSDATKALLRSPK